MTPQIESARIKRAMLITLILNFTLGVVNATWVSRIPAIRDALSLQPSEIGLILLMGSVGSLIALPTTGPLTNRIGTAVAARIGSTVWAVGLTGMGLSVLMVSRPMKGL